MRFDWCAILLGIRLIEVGDIECNQFVVFIIFGLHQLLRVAKWQFLWFCHRFRPVCMSWTAAVVLLRAEVVALAWHHAAKAVNIWSFFPVPHRDIWVFPANLGSWHWVNSASLVERASEKLDTEDAEE